MKRTKSVKVSRKYQITIPKNIREIAGIDKMDRVYFEVEEDGRIFSHDFIKKERSNW